MEGVNQVTFHLYHYAGNNPVRYVDPTGAFDIENFYLGIVDLFAPTKNQFSKFNVYTSKKITKEEYNYYQNNMSELEPDSILSASGGRYSTLLPTEFGKMSTAQKLESLNNERNKLIEKYESNKSDGIDVFNNLGYGSGETLFSANSCSNFEEFALNFLFNNAENIGDLAQFNLDAINILKGIYHVDTLIDFYSQK